MSGKFKSLVNTRGYVRARVTRTYNDVQANVDIYDLGKSNKTISSLKDDAASLKDLDDKILDLVWDDSLSDAANSVTQNTELDNIALYRDRINDILIIVEDKLKTLNLANPQSVPNLPNQNLLVNTSRLKPETAPLPTYGGERDESLEKFIFSFEAITGAHQYSDFEKFLLLQKSMKGRAVVLINSLEIDKQSYTDAKALLQEAFAAPLTQKYNALERLTDLRLPVDSDPLFLVSEVRQIKEAFNRLQIDINLVLQFFYWKALPESIKVQLINITNQCKPSLTDIENNIFQAIERDQNSCKSVSANKNSEYVGSLKRKTNAFALKVEHGSQNKRNDRAPFECTLCTEEHPYFKCPKFRTPCEKVKRLRELEGCVRCGFINHKSDNCRLSNLKCKLCGGAHFPCLCVKNGIDYGNSKNVPDKPVSKTVRKYNNNIIWTSHAGSSVEGLALPTFTASVNDKLVRIMRDTGAQATLISDKLANSLNLNVLKNDISITINGFNGAKNYVTKLVEVPMKLNGDSNKLVMIKALCVPNINISLDVPGLGIVVEKLVSKGYYLADKLFDNKVSQIRDIDIVLGSDFAYCNPITTKIFGKNLDSTLLMTPVGVMIEGSIQKLIDDMYYLDENEVVNSFNISLIKERKDFVCNEDCGISAADLQTATDSILETQCSLYLDCDETIDESSVEVNNKLSAHVLKNTTREETGRLVMPLMWNSEVQHLLGHNYNVSKQILKSNFRKLSKDPIKLKLTDNVFREQEALGIIERIDNFDNFRQENPNYSFLPHMSVFRLNKDTTKCRVVNLSNITERNPELPTTVSHNQAIMSGPNLNQKLSTSLLLLKFDKYLIIFDLVKAFLMIAMTKLDQARLLLMWYKNVDKENFEIVYFKAKRLPFGISCAPALLMLALYKILIIDDDGTDEDVSKLRSIVFTLFYMDNGGYTSNDLVDLSWARQNLINIFGNYEFKLQQFVCNNSDLQRELDSESGEVTPEVVNLYGLKWNRVTDCLSTASLNLNSSANTKRLILKTYAENFDVYGYNLPLLNRTKLFIHRLQCDTGLTWDSKLTADLQSEWRLICNQIKSVEVAEIHRYVGKRSDAYQLVAFTDASKQLYGVVLYLVNLNTLEVSFLLAKNRIVSKSLERKSIPSLELLGVVFGVETLQDTYNELCTSDLMNPVKIEEMYLFTDSMINLNWLDGVTSKLSKSQNKLSVFVRNRLYKIKNLCDNKSVTFSFISGEDNPADKVTRSISFKQLCKANFHEGPVFLKRHDKFQSILSITVPCPDFLVNSVTVTFVNCLQTDQLVPQNRYSSFNKMVNVLAYIMKFVHNLKRSIGKVELSVEPNFFVESRKEILKSDQNDTLRDCFTYFQGDQKVRSMPNIIKQLNLFPDSDGILRVRAKFVNRKYSGVIYEPILLSKDSLLASSIIYSLHVRMGHAGKYVVLNEFRKEFYIPSIFSKVKSVLKACILCRRFNARPVALNQSSYRDERLNPPAVPFRFSYLDHFGPYNVKLGGKKVKVYLLLITCMYTRAFNTEICMDMTCKSFLRAFQMHVHKYGIASRITSDPGSTLVAGGNIISAFINDESVQSYLAQFDINKIDFSQFCKGNSSLGGLVESGVKLYKRLIYGFIRNNCLEFFDFQFIISDVNHIINKRPVAFMAATRDSAMDHVPEVITPEMIIHGSALPSVNCIPGLHPVPSDPDWVGKPVKIVRDSYEKLRLVRTRMLEMYNQEFFSKLVDQAVDKGDRYVSKKHAVISIGDVVCLKEKFCKPNNYPLAVVKEVTVNDFGEITSARIKRGDTGEIVNRHSSVLIPLLQLHSSNDDQCEAALNGNSKSVESIRKILPKRKAAVRAASAMEQLKR